MKRKRRSNVCEICDYKCVRRDHMIQHMHVHADQRLFVCPVDGCVVDYKRKDHLIRHVKSKHKARIESNNEGEQPNICLTSFDSSSVARLAPQAEFSTEGADPMTRGSELKRTILELRQENVRLQGKYAKVESETQAAIEAKVVANKLLASLSEQRAKDQEIAAVQQRDLIADIGKYRGAVEKCQTELKSLIKKSQSLEMACSSGMEMRTKLEELKRTECELQDRLEEKKHKLIEGENLRKKMHNTILDLKGNIRVFCRVRPLVPDDGVGADASVIAYPSSLEFQGRGIDLIQKGRKHTFTFDQVFGHEASQEDVFVEISELVQCAVDGYKVCIFSYGLTGSGKTYTMVGESEALEQKGLIPRSMEHIFQTSQSLLAQGWKYKMQASMLEIHNETIHDLLPTSVEKVVQGKTCEIKEDENGNVFVSNLNIIDVGNVSEVSSLLRQAAQSRSVGKTLMNEKSSRGHFVSTLHISGVNEATEQQVHGVLNLIDLAGRGRLQKTRATGDLLKETQAINKSLSSLGDVIFSLAKNRRHVPFRNSKLTHLLKPCLGGDSKTLMFVNISSDRASVDETLCSLQFAERVNACKIGVPKRGTK